MWGLRSALPKVSTWRTVQFDTLRQCLIKVAARVTELKTLIPIQWPAACPDQKILPLALDRIPRLITGTTGQCTLKSNAALKPANLNDPEIRIIPGNEATRPPLAQNPNPGLR